MYEKYTKNDTIRACISLEMLGEILILRVSPFFLSTVV